METHDWREIDDKVSEATFELFESCGATAAFQGLDVPLPAVDSAALAVIGFGGDHVRGSLILVLTERVLRTTYPGCQEDPMASNDEVLDWAGELANQLLGRIKNKLLGRGLVMQLSTPTTIEALQIRLGAVPAQNDSRPRSFMVGGELVQLRFVAVEQPGGVPRPTGSQATAAEEGSLMMF